MSTNALALNWDGVTLPDEIKAGVEELVASYHDQLEETALSGIILYGSGARGHYRSGVSDVNLLVILDRVDTAALDHILDATLSARRYNIAPLLMTPDDLRSFTRVFPIKLLSFKESYTVLWGEDALAALEVESANLRLRCQQEAQNLLMRLRRHYLTRQGHAQSTMIREHMNGFMEVLRRVVQLAEGEVPRRADLVARASAVIGFDSETLRSLMAFRKSSGDQEPEATPGIYNSFMLLAEQVARFTEKLGE